MKDFSRLESSKREKEREKKYWWKKRLAILEIAETGKRKIVNLLLLKQCVYKKNERQVIFVGLLLLMGHRIYQLVLESVFSL